MAVELAVGAGMRPPGGQVEGEGEEETAARVGSGVASERRASAKQYAVMFLIERKMINNSG